LAIKENSLGKEHPDLAVTLNNLANLYQVQGRYEEAEPLYQRSLEILKKAFPAGHPNIDIFKSNYAELQQKMGSER
jgi:tetratricopeptide (TPR) repeat protein